MKVAVLGATGETGSSIINALVASTEPKFQVTALLRPASVGGEAAAALERRGVRIVPTDLEGGGAGAGAGAEGAEGVDEGLVAAVQGQDVVISAIRAFDLLKQLPLIDAAKKAGVARFVPCDFGPVAPPKGFMSIRETKEDIRNYIKKTKLPYTFIDVGWWYQLGFPSLPSGKVDYAAVVPGRPSIPGDGTVPSAMTDERDVGEWVRRIIADPRTLNQQVFAYNELWTKRDLFALMERLSGETIERNYMSEEAIKQALAQAVHSGPQGEQMAILLNYYLSWGIRGDNTPEYARYLGYQLAHELYPDFQPRTFEAFVHELLSGTADKVYGSKGQGTGSAIQSASKGIGKGMKKAAGGAHEQL